ncbi:hypothetical protein KC19_12G101700 [Ceratodon purpureus]|uniref:Uncharacterized protein n=1 Tax=Ceratodon purpureus TaxID=3225 RepID=A0A8T0G6W0_CERPU|nr:hypothetical protein KC19_12G101700 [Ceratodon purpureus]
MMDSSHECHRSKVYNESKALILQSLRDIITQEEWEKEKAIKSNKNCITIKDPLKNVQNKLKEQLLEKKWTIEKKLCGARMNLRKAKAQREQVGHKLDAMNKKYVFQCNCLNKVLKQHQVVVSSHAKVKEALEYQKSIHNEATEKRRILTEELECAEIEMNRLGKVLFQMYNQSGC